MALTFSGVPYEPPSNFDSSIAPLAGMNLAYGGRKVFYARLSGECKYLVTFNLGWSGLTEAQKDALQAVYNAMQIAYVTMTFDDSGCTDSAGNALESWEVTTQPNGGFNCDPFQGWILSGGVMVGPSLYNVTFSLISEPLEL